MQPPDQVPDPYQPPATDTAYRSELATAAADPQMIKKFRQQIHALGGLWIILGCLVFLVVGWMVTSGLPRGTAAIEDVVMLTMVGGIGAMWLVIGILTSLKSLPAVYVGLVLSYISAVLQLVSLNLCGLVILIVVILQAHRVIGWANRMRAADIPLTAQPD